MDIVWPRRLLWRRRGAWLWPAFVTATVADAFIGHALPIQGDGESLGAAGVVGLIVNLIAVLLLSRPLGALVRRWRRDLPAVVARDSAGTLVVATITVLFLAGGLLHHAAVARDGQAQQDAIVRAQAYIGDRAPAEFRRDVRWISVFAIQPGSLYRACVPGVVDGRTYCVIVDTRQPFPGGVRFSGYEPNATFSLGEN